jgi:hypothetical protein
VEIEKRSNEYKVFLKERFSENRVMSRNKIKQRNDVFLYEKSWYFFTEQEVKIGSF